MILKILFISIFVLCVTFCVYFSNSTEHLPSGAIIPGLGQLSDMPSYCIKETYTREDIEYLSSYAKHMVSQCAAFNQEDLPRWKMIDRKLDFVLYGDN